jgi:GT2 family glycosyltransferase
VPQAQVVHYGGQSTRQVASEMFLQLYQNKVKYFRKHHGGLQAMLYKCILFVAGLGRLVVIPLAWLEGSAKRQAHLTMAGNYRRLIQALPGL